MFSKLEINWLNTEIVLPALLIETPLAPTRLDVAGADMAIWELFVPDNVTLIPEKFSVLPEAVVLPAVLPDRLAYIAPPPPPPVWLMEIVAPFASVA